ncbi:MAG: Gfo/Idh/MocA family protein [Planctomycetota bacterium]
MTQSRKINRRRFLRKAAGLAAGAISFPYIVSSFALGRAGSVVPSERITMGLVGMGGRGIANMWPLLEKTDARIVAVCDVDANHLGRARDIINKDYDSGDCAAYNDFRELLARKDIDAVVIATPDHWHSLIAIAAAKAGKDIYCEKPLAYSIGEGRSICDAVKKYKVVWQTGSQQRSERNFRRACELVRNGRIGKVHTIRVGLPYGNGFSGGGRVMEPDLTKPASVPDGFDYDMWLGPAPSAPYSPGRCHVHWRWVSDYAGGQITDWAGHHCDIAQWAMDTEYTSPVEIEGSGTFPKAVDGLYDTAESYRFVCKYAEGFTMIVSDSRQYPETMDGVRLTEGYKKGLGALFEGTDGWIQVNRGGLDVYPKSLLKSRIGPDEIHLYNSNNHIDNFLDCIRTRSQTAAPVEIAHRSIMVGHLGIIAIRTGRKLRWDPLNERFINDPEADRLLSRPMRSPWHL